MARYLTPVGTSYQGGISDTSTPKLFVGQNDPHGVAGVALAVGDSWLHATDPPGTPPPAYPPGPPGTYDPVSATSGFAPTGQVLVTYPTTGGPFGNIVNGDLTITASNVTMIGYDFHCRIVNKAVNLSVLRSWIRGNATQGTNSALIDCTNAAVVNCLIQDCLLVPDVPSYWWDGVIGHDYKLSRCEVYYTVDGSGQYNTHNAGGPVNVTVEACYFHDSTYWSPDPSHTSDAQPPGNIGHSHCDTGAQLQGGSNFHFIGNNVVGFCTTLYGQITLDAAHANAQGGYNIHYPYLQSSSCMQFTTGTGPVSDVVIDKNLFGGGAFSINFGPASQGVYTNITITNNRFKDDQRPDSPGYITLPASAINATLTGNVHFSDGTPVPINRS